MNDYLNIRVERGQLGEDPYEGADADPELPWLGLVLEPAHTAIRTRRAVGLPAPPASWCARFTRADVDSIVQLVGTVGRCRLSITLRRR
jgi:hypothetical protein